MRRKLGWIASAVLFGLAALFAAWDVMDYAAGNPWKIAPLGQRWFELHRDSLLLLQPAVERYLFPGLWSAIQWILERPAWLVPAVTGAAVALVKIVRRR
ncbi:MAG: hypothetical protein ACREEV_18015 [Dongiaceae bacterium]